MPILSSRPDKPLGRSAQISIDAAPENIYSKGIYLVIAFHIYQYQKFIALKPEA